MTIVTCTGCGRTARRPSAWVIASPGLGRCVKCRDDLWEALSTYGDSHFNHMEQSLLLDAEYATTPRLVQAYARVFAHLAVERMRGAHEYRCYWGDEITENARKVYEYQRAHGRALALVAWVLKRRAPLDTPPSTD